MIKSARPETVHDEQMLKLYSAAYVAQQRLQRAETLVARYTKEGGTYAARYLPDVTRDRDAALTGFRAAVEALDAHEAAYTGWQRYFLVVSSAGLIHASQSCHTCNKGRSATQFALLPSMSGLSDMSSLVDACGAALCSVCFPEAPTAWVDAVRLPTSVTLVLFEQGEEAFQAALTAWKGKQVAKTAAQCDGSGKPYVPGTATPPRYRQSRYAECPGCHKRHVVTNSGKIRKHAK